MHKRSIGVALGLAAVTAALMPATAAWGSTSNQLGPARYTTIQHAGVNPDAARPQGVTVPFWSRSFTALGNPYVTRMVGKDPFVHVANASTTAVVDIYPVSFKFTSFGNALFDPTAADPCDGNKTALARTKSSPLFNNSVWKAGTNNIGTTQAMDAFQRENFWPQAKAGGVNPTLHVLLSGVTKPTILINVGGGNVVNTTCGKVGEIDINVWDPFLTGTLFPSIHPSPGHLAFFLFRNVVLYQNTFSNCCILGYHSAIAAGSNTQTYGIGEYDTSKGFGSNVADTSVLSHELGEWMDDPFVNNATPAWGHIGQVSGCQANLEVGDPLSGKLFTVTMAGKTYHLQDLAFRSWFHRNAAPILNWQSWRGTFTSFQATVCH